MTMRKKEIEPSAPGGPISVKVEEDTGLRTNGKMTNSHAVLAYSLDYWDWMNEKRVRSSIPKVGNGRSTDYHRDPCAKEHNCEQFEPGQVFRPRATHLSSADHPRNQKNSAEQTPGKKRAAQKNSHFYCCTS